MFAVHFHRLEAADLLLKRGASVNLREPRVGSSALHDAAYTGSPLMM